MKLFILLSVSIACAIVSSASAYPRKSRIQRPYFEQDDYNAIDRKWPRDEEMEGSMDRGIPIDDEDDDQDDDWSNESDDWEDESQEQNDIYNDDDDEDEVYQQGDRLGIDHFKRPLYNKQEWYDDEDDIPRMPAKTHLAENEWPVSEPQKKKPQPQPPTSGQWHRLKLRM